MLYSPVQPRNYFIERTVIRFQSKYGKRANLKTDVSRKQSTPTFSKNKHFLTQDTPHVHKFGVVYFLETLVLTFVLLPYYQRYIQSFYHNSNQQVFDVLFACEGLLHLGSTWTSQYEKTGRKWGWEAYSEPKQTSKMQLLVKIVTFCHWLFS